MKPNKSWLALILAFVIVFSIAGLLQRQKDFNSAFQANAQTALTNPQHYTAWTFLATYNLATFAEKAPLPNNSTRTEIYNFINANPGVQFRAICSSLGLPIGVVQFHIAILQKNGLVNAIRKGKYKRFFTSGRFSRKQMETIATLRLSTVRNILKILLQGKRVSNHELAMRLSISSQGLTWQMNRLRQTGLILENRKHLTVSYSLETAYIPIVTETITLLEN
jgi:predicted transcriptional regulator